LNKRTVRMRRCVGRYFGGNHYFELLVSKNNSPELSIKKNQVVILYHTGCQSIESLIRPDLAQNYFFQKKYVAAKKSSEMQEAFFTAQEMLLRYTHAYRDTVQKFVDSVFRKHYKGSSTYLVDSQHNSVTKDNFGNGDVFVYRHNAVTLNEGSFGIVSGMRDHESYLVQGGESIGEYYNTIDHGLGSILDRGVNKSPIPNQFVTLKRYKQGMSVFKMGDKSVEVKKSKDVSLYFDLLKKKKIASVKVALQPLINFKHSK
jgi:RNA-splicing ligase RtcB